MTGVATRSTRRWFSLALALPFGLLLQPGAGFGRQGAARPEQAANNAAAQQGAQTGGGVPRGVNLVPTMPAAGAPTAFHFPQAATKTIANGLRIFVVPDHAQPDIAVRLVILTAGGIKDPPGMPGIAQMTASLLTQGTATRSARDIAEAIDFVGGSLEASAGKDATTVTLNIVKKDLSTGLGLISDIVLHPAFKSDELERQRQQLLSNLILQ